MVGMANLPFAEIAQAEGDHDGRAASMDGGDYWSHRMHR